EAQGQRVQRLPRPDRGLEHEKDREHGDDQHRHQEGVNEQAGRQPPLPHRASSSTRRVNRRLNMVTAKRRANITTAKAAMYPNRKSWNACRKASIRTNSVAPSLRAVVNAH